MTEFEMYFKPKDETSSEDTLPSREIPILPPKTHSVLHTPMEDTFPGKDRLMVGMGCFWGAERKFWQVPGVVSTAVGYAAGRIENPTYQDVCTGRTGHNEVVRIVFDQGGTSLAALLKLFWESHNPTEGMRQGNDLGTQYRSGIYTYSEPQKQAAEASKTAYQVVLSERGYGEITTEILDVPMFYYAESYHQQYLHKNPGGYCGLGGTGIPFPEGI